MLGALQGEAHPLRSALSLWAQLASGGIRRLPCPLAPKASYKEVGSGSFTQWPQAQLTMGGAAEEEEKPLLLALISATPSPSPRCPFNWKPREVLQKETERFHPVLAKPSVSGLLNHPAFHLSGVPLFRGTAFGGDSSTHMEIVTLSHHRMSQRTSWRSSSVGTGLGTWVPRIPFLRNEWEREGPLSQERTR